MALRLDKPLADGVVLLRAMESRDRDTVLETMRDPHVRHWFNMPAEPSHTDFELLLAQTREGWERGDRLDLQITAPPDDVAVGSVIASRRVRDNWELAYLAGPRGRGRGLVARAVLLVCEWLFEQGVQRIEIRTHPDNADSQRLAERLGFQREGRERRSIWLHGQRCDALVYSLLPDDPR
ncbi:MAG TPA: GNAT family protein [Gaiellaceae bacterium]